MVETNLSFLRTCCPVDGSALKALVATLLGALVEPASCSTRLGVNQVQRISVVVLSGKVCLTTAVASLIEVPTSNDVGLAVSSSDVLSFTHSDFQLAVGGAVVPVVEGDKTLVLVSGENDLLTSLVHPLAFDNFRCGSNGDHIVVSSFDGQVQCIGLNLLEVGCQRFIAVDCVLELSFLRNLLTGSVGPVHEVIAEVFGSSQCDLAAILILVSLRVSAYATCLLRIGSNSQRVHLDSGLGAVDNTRDADIGKASLLIRIQTCCCIEVEAAS